MDIKPKQDSYGEMFIVAERAERCRKLARMFAIAMTTTSPLEQGAIIAEIRRMLRMDAKEPSG